MDSQGQLDILVTFTRRLRERSLRGKKSVEAQAEISSSHHLQAFDLRCSPVSAVVGLAQIKAVLQLPIRHADSG
jgi:hypothetical protein